MADLEDQLRQYADQVESAVEPVAPRGEAASPRGRFPLLTAAAALLVIVAALAVWFARDASESDPAGVPDLIVEGGSTTSSTTTPLTQPPAVMIPVPDVGGLLQADAVDVLIKAGLNPMNIVQKEASEVPEGTVLRTHPVAGIEVEEAGTVVLIVSTGPEVVAIPDVEGLSVIDAIDALSDAGFTVVGATPPEEPHEQIAVGAVIRTEPVANQLVPAGSQVSIVVSTGVPQVIVPQLDGLFADTAIQTLRNSGLASVVVFEAVPAGSPQAGRVISQDPAAFEEVDAGFLVTISVGEAT